MALTGPEAKPQKIGHSPTADWLDVPDVAFDDKGERDLPRSPGGRRKWHQQVLEWWEEVRRMPHCTLWSDTDWRFARETAYIKQQMWADMDAGDVKSTLITEIRRREDLMGYTLEARRKLRIRYVDPEAAKRQQTGGLLLPGGAGNVVAIGDRRDRLTG